MNRKSWSHNLLDRKEERKSEQDFRSMSTPVVLWAMRKSPKGRRVTSQVIDRV